MITHHLRRAGARRLAVATAAVTLIGLGAGCGSSAGAPGAPGSVTGGPGAGAAPAAGGALSPGVPVSSLSCDRFTRDDLQAALRTVLPSGILAAAATDPDAAVDPGHLSCAYNVDLPGVEPSSDAYTDARLDIDIWDDWDHDGVVPPADSQAALQRIVAENRESFRSYRANVRSYSDGKPDDLQVVHTYRDATGLGADAFLSDAVTLDDTGAESQSGAEVDILRAARPFSVTVNISYVYPQLDEPSPGAALDHLLRAAAGRASLVEAVAPAVLGKI